MNNAYGYNEQGKFYDKFHKNPQRQLIVFTPHNTLPKSTIKLEQWNNTKTDGNLSSYHQFLYYFIALILWHKEIDFLDVLLWTNKIITKYKVPSYTKPTDTNQFSMPCLAIKELIKSRLHWWHKPSQDWKEFAQTKMIWN